MSEPCYCGAYDCARCFPGSYDGEDEEYEPENDEPEDEEQE